jgi:Tfp pilus assembly protein PilO
MIKLSRREKLLAILASGVMLGAFIFRGIIEPAVRNWIALNQQIALKEAKLTRALKIIAQKPEVQAEFDGYQKFILPPVSEEEEIARLLREIEKLARDTGMRITDMAPRRKQRSEFYTRFTVEIETEGSMEGLMRFIYALETSPFLFTAERLKITLKSRQSNILKSDILLSKVSL